MKRVDHLSYFPFFASDWLTGQATTRMTPEQKGAFVDLLAHAWIAKPPCTLENDDAVLAKLSGLGPRWKRTGALVRAQFVPRPDGLLINPKQFEVWQTVDARRTVYAQNGRLGAAAKWQPDGKDDGKPDGKAIANVMANGWQNDGILNLNLNTKKEKALSSLEDPEQTAEKAARFLDRYPGVYAKVRSGARYMVKPARDHHYAMQLVSGWPDPARLDLMAEVFLRMSAKEANNIPGTPGQFLHMAPECDARLRENGR